MTPKISLAMNLGLSTSDLKTIEQKIREHENEIKEAWKQHFGS